MCGFINIHILIVTQHKKIGLMCTKYRIAVNISGRKYCQIYTFRLFVGETFSEWPTNRTQILTTLREKTSAIGH